MPRIVNRIQDFMKLETSAGIILMFAAALALFANNSFLSGYYDQFLNTPVKIQIGALILAKPLLLWINDGLMAIFFFLVGLEVKREILQGELSSLSKASLPLIAAIGGMAGPAIIYSFINWGDADTMRGWAIPSATDIAFALGVLALLGPRVPVSLKIFLLALAIIDDIGAISIIAIFYTENLSVTTLGLGFIGFIGLVIMNKMGVKAITPYALVGTFIWVCVLKSGVHATLAGVLTALTIPIAGKTGNDQSPLHHLEHALHPWVAYLVLPVFAFANAGVSLAGLSLADLTATVPLGIALGLFFGNQIMIFVLSFLAVKIGISKMPEGVRWVHIYGTGCLAGIGFTMSLFIGTLAFSDPDLVNQVRLGVLMGSFASAILGFTVLKLTLGQEQSSKAKLEAQPAE
ncbi:MAG: Na+/H+ antiporter NhaA [Rhizobiaceae bacterium]|nr:Na+/H+ antiporter NhaA [Rhizobiaceae bacterium]